MGHLLLMRVRRLRTRWISAQFVLQIAVQIVERARPKSAFKYAMHKHALGVLLKPLFDVWNLSVGSVGILLRFTVLVGVVVIRVLIVEVTVVLTVILFQRITH